MAINMEEAKHGLEAGEELIALNILLVIYLHDRRYLEALEDIEELLKDPEIQKYREYLLLKQDEVRQDLARLSSKRKAGCLQFVFDLFHNPA